MSRSTTMNKAASRIYFKEFTFRNYIPTSHVSRFAMLLAAIFTIVVTLLVRPTSSPVCTLPNPPVILPMHAAALEWSEITILPDAVSDAVSDVVSERDTAARDKEATLLKIAAYDRAQVAWLAEIVRLLDPALVLDQLQPEYQGIPELAPFWPEFQQGLRAWALRRRNDPAVMQSLVAQVKAPLDKHYYGVESPPEMPLNLAQKCQLYKRCAVVGNSGTLLGRRYGALIDTHDAVVRLNNAGIEGYEPFVGAKTTLAFVNSNILHRCFSHEANCSCHPYGDQVAMAMYICQVPHWMDVTVCRAQHRAPLLVMDAGFDTLVRQLVKWYSVKAFVEEDNNTTQGRSPWEWGRFHDDAHFHYSSGMQAVVLALGICEEVNLFGFGKNASFPHHYHSPVQEAELGIHDYRAEYMLYEDLAHSRSVPFLRDSGIPLPPLHIYR